MPMTAAQKLDAYRFFAIAFGAAPGKTYFDQIAQAYEAGVDTRTIVNVYTTKAQFLERYPAQLDHQAFANKLIDDVVGTTATDAAKQEAKQAVVKALQEGVSRGDVIYAIFNNLANKSFNDSQWGTTALALSKKVAVAQFITETLADPTTSLTTLQGYVNNVDANTSLADAYQNLVSQFRSQNNGKFVTYGNNADSITGTDAADLIDGGAGDDTITGGKGDDVLYGGSGADKIYGGVGADYIDGGLGPDYIEAGYFWWYEDIYSGNRWLGTRTVYDLSTNVVFGGGGSDTIHGGYGADLLHGGDGDDVIDDTSGANTIDGGSGADTIQNSGSLESILGGAGDDKIMDWNYLYRSSTLGRNTIDGGDGNDTIYARVPRNLIDGGNGNDNIVTYAGSTVIGGAGDDTITVSSYSEAVTMITPGDGHDAVTIYLDSPPDDKIIINLRESTQGRDLIDIETNSSTSLIQPIVFIQGFDKTQDRFDLGSFNVLGQSWLFNRAGYYSSWSNAFTESYVQIITSTSTPFASYKSTTPRGPDDYGKGFFVIQGAAAASSDTITVANFLDPYGNNHTYWKSATYYFLINVGTSDMALYRFRDDTGADNKVVPDELLPIAVFEGMRTEQLTALDLLSVFI